MILRFEVEELGKCLDLLVSAQQVKCFFLKGAVTGLSRGERSLSARVQLVPRSGLVQGCCLVETDDFNGKYDG